MREMIAGWSVPAYIPCVTRSLTTQCRFSPGAPGWHPLRFRNLGTVSVEPGKRQLAYLLLSGGYFQLPETSGNLRRLADRRLRRGSYAGVRLTLDGPGSASSAVRARRQAASRSRRSSATRAAADSRIASACSDST
jgi:hypothetical protein